MMSLFFPFFPQGLQLALDRLIYFEYHAAKVDNYHSTNNSNVGPAESVPHFCIIDEVSEQKHEVGGHQQGRLVKDLHSI